MPTMAQSAGRTDGKAILTMGAAKKFSCDAYVAVGPLLTLGSISEELCTSMGLDPIRWVTSVRHLVAEVFEMLH